MNQQRTEQHAWRVSMEIGRQRFEKRLLGDAINAFRQATKLLPARVEGWVNLGSALLESGQFEAAVAALGRAIELKPGSGVAHMLLGDAFRQLGDLKVAVQSYRRAVSLQRSPLALNKLACALRVNNQVVEAEALYREAIALAPGFSLAHVNLATLHIERGDFAAGNALLSALHQQPLPPEERAEVRSAQGALAEYFRLREPIATLCEEHDSAPLHTALRQAPAAELGVDENALDKVRRYIRWAVTQGTRADDIAGTPPPDWPVIEALFMIPLIGTTGEYRDIRARLDAGETATGDLAESLTMVAAIEAARACRDDLGEPVLTELHLRHWHALACRGIDGFMPGHFKYTQNWSMRSPTFKRVDPALASGTFRQFVAELYAAVGPGLVRAGVAFIGFLDLHPFADGNGRVALTWLNRELEWAGLMPALFSRELALKGETGMKLKAARGNDGDLTELLAVIQSAQAFAVEFCAELARR